MSAPIPQRTERFAANYAYRQDEQRLRETVARVVAENVALRSENTILAQGIGELILRCNALEKRVAGLDERLTMRAILTEHTKPTLVPKLDPYACQTEREPRRVVAAIGDVWKRWSA